jgi:hypothetical protein
MPKQQQLIDALTDTLMQRCMHFVFIEDYATSDAIYAEFVVNEVESEEGKYEWLFMQSFPSLH